MLANLGGRVHLNFKRCTAHNNDTSSVFTFSNHRQPSWASGNWPSYTHKLTTHRRGHIEQKGIDEKFQISRKLDIIIIIKYELVTRQVRRLIYDNMTDMSFLQSETQFYDLHKLSIRQNNTRTYISRIKILISFFRSIAKTNNRWKQSSICGAYTSRHVTRQHSEHLTLLTDENVLYRYAR